MELLGWRGSDIPKSCQAGILLILDRRGLLSHAALDEKKEKEIL